MLAAKAGSVSQDDLSKGNLSASPRMRISRSASLVLSNTWQRVDFNGTSTSNINSFPYVTGTSGAKTTDWDGTNKLIKFNDSTDKTFTFTFFYIVNGGIRPINILYRFVIPSTPAFYFPFPDESAPYGRLEDIQSILEVRESKVGTIYSNASMRSFGLGFELKVGTSLLGGLLPPTLINCAFLIYAR